MNNLQIWENIIIDGLKLEGIKDFDKVKYIANKIYKMLLENNCSIIETEKILNILNQKLLDTKKLILQEPLETVLKYKEDWY